MPNRHPLITVAVFLFSPMLALSQTAPAPVGAWSFSLGAQRYAEPAMQLVGPEIGLHWRSMPLASLGQAQLEAEAVVGRQTYSSDRSGSMNNVLNIETRWRSLWPMAMAPSISYGLALHTHSNYLEGMTSTGHRGYDRKSTQLWLPFRWTDAGQYASLWGPAKKLTVDAGVLLFGQQISKLSQANAATYIDINNTQHTGIYIQTKADYSTASGTYSPFIRWTWVDDSNKVNGLRSGHEDYYEPINRRLQIGVEWRYSR